MILKKSLQSAKLDNKYMGSTNTVDREIFRVDKFPRFRSIREFF